MKAQLLSSLIPSYSMPPQLALLRLTRSKSHQIPFPECNPTCPRSSSKFLHTSCDTPNSSIISLLPLVRAHYESISGLDRCSNSLLGTRWTIRRTVLFDSLSQSRSRSRRRSESVRDESTRHVTEAKSVIISIFPSYDSYCLKLDGGKTRQTHW